MEHLQFEESDRLAVCLGNRIYTSFASRRGARFVSKNLIFTSFTQNKTTSVAKRPPNVKPHLPHFRVQNEVNEVNEVRFLGGIGVTEVVLFGKMRYK